jgi:hypothetical protein
MVPATRAVRLERLIGASDPEIRTSLEMLRGATIVTSTLLQALTAIVSARRSDLATSTTLVG